MRPLIVLRKTPSLDFMSLHKAGFVRTPLPVYLKTSDWKRDPGGRVNVESLEKLSTFMLEKLNWLEKPVNVREMVDLSHLPR